MVKTATDDARTLWNGYADRLAEQVLAGQRVQSKQQAAAVYTRLERIMNQLREEFGPIGQPTFEGREIVLGPRAGNYYLVQRGLKEGELVVTQGNLWKEFAMLLGNDAFEGRHVKQMSEADRLFLALKATMRRMRDRLGITTAARPHIDHIAVSPQFQAELAAVWEGYLAIQRALIVRRSSRR